MSQRNPLNERYQNADERKGTTRKSAASAKPATKAASSVRTQSSKQPEQKGILGRAKTQANKSQNSKAATQKQREREHQKQQFLHDDSSFFL